MSEKDCGFGNNAALLVERKKLLDDCLSGKRRTCPECAGPVLVGRNSAACAHCGWGVSQRQLDAVMAQEAQKP